MKFPKMTHWFLGLCCAVSLTTQVSYATEDPVRVAFLPQQAGFYYVEENGGFAGYYYDYLMEVAAYTGWDYEFVVIDEGWSSYDVAKGMLLQGELDLLGPMFATDDSADVFVYGKQHNGLSRYTLCTSPSSSITADNYFFQDSISVALVESDTGSVDAFHQLMERYDTPYEITYVDSQDTALTLLRQREVETVMSMDVYSNYGILEQIDTVNPTPFYFVSNQENAHFITELDRASKALDVAEPGLHQRLLETYFDGEYDGTIVLSVEEEAALQDYDYFNIGLMRNVQPYQFYNEDTDRAQGISPEILDLISQVIGVEFRYVWVDSYDELAEKVASQEVDICATLPFDYDLPERFGVVLTRPYITSGVQWLHHSNEVEDVEYYYHFVTDNIPQIPDDDLIRVENIQDIIVQLSEEGNISLICDPYIAQYHLQKLAILNVDMQNMSHVHSEITLGVGNHIDTTIVGLLNRGILHLDPYDVDEIIYRNVTNTGRISLSAFVQQNVGQIILCIVLAFAGILFCLSYHARKLRILSEQDGLTKLYNSGYFHHYAAERAEKLSSGVLILFDIDYFKQVNDTFGHQTGDKVIISVAQNVKDLFHDHGVVARLGGDEFVALLEGEREEMEEKCTTLLKKMETSVENVPVSLSIGGIRFHGPTPYKELYRMADECLYQVKENGKKGFHFAEKNNTDR